VLTIQSRYGYLLTAEDHYGRADMFLWRGDTTSAKGMSSRLTSDRKDVVDARIGLIKNVKNVDKLVNAVPAAYTEDAGLLYERARWNERKARRRKSSTCCCASMAEGRRRSDVMTSGSRSQSVMRRMIREQNYATAYQLAAGHGLTAGESFRDAEWIAGWLALTKLGAMR